jgi:hypothetical protein
MADCMPFGGELSAVLGRYRWGRVGRDARTVHVLTDEWQTARPYKGGLSAS